MNIQITSRKFRAKDSLKEYITQEIQSLEKFYDDILEANVILSYTHLKDSIKTAEVVLKIPGKILTGTHSSDDYKKSVDDVVNKLSRQLKKAKTKNIDKKR